MGRSAVTTRDAGPEDLDQLAELWGTNLRGTDGRVDLEVVLARSTARPDQRIVVAECDGEFAGAVLLVTTTVSPLNLQQVVHLVHPTVLPPFRRRGAGCALVEAAVALAEERGIEEIGTAALSASRDANRFMARLGLSTRATLRLAPTALVRGRLNAMRPGTEAQLGARTASSRQRGQVLAVRRSLRRQPRVG